ncbi:hypothetical protein [Dankookia rubra]|uniref:hypothetical protein n=1 Tax=Dankookia rubra TaxID=1442381 RepID=UPI00140C2C2F|nr:hypothetical protein [Dankookia rubra]
MRAVVLAATTFRHRTSAGGTRIVATEMAKVGDRGLHRVRDAEGKVIHTALEIAA